MTIDGSSRRQQGRQIRLVPVAPSTWLVVLGCAVMGLGPLFGFLIGTVVGTDNEVLGMSPLFLFLFLGFLVAGVGLGIAMLGVRHMLRDRPRP